MTFCSISFNHKTSCATYGNQYDTFCRNWTLTPCVKPPAKYKTCNHCDFLAKPHGNSKVTVLPCQHLNSQHRQRLLYNTLLIQTFQRCFKVWLPFVAELAHIREVYNFALWSIWLNSSSVTVLVTLNKKCQNSVSTVYLLLLCFQLIGSQFHTCHLISHLYCIKSFPHPCYHTMHHNDTVNCGAASVTSPKGDFSVYWSLD